MLDEADDNSTTDSTTPTEPASAPAKRARKATRATPDTEPATAAASEAEPAAKKAVKKAVKKATKKAAAQKPAAQKPAAQKPAAEKSPAEEPTAEKPAAKKSAAKKTAKKSAKKAGGPAADNSAGTAGESTAAPVLAAPAAPAVVFQAPLAAPVAGRGAGRGTRAAEPAPAGPDLTAVEEPLDHVALPDDVREAASEEATGARRRRRRGRRGRGGGGQRGGDGAAETGGDESGDEALEAATADGQENAAEAAPDGEAGTHRRRRRKRATSSDAEPAPDDPPNTVVHVRSPREAGTDDGVKAVKGSTRLEAKRQRRRDGRETTRRRAPILTEAEFLARRESVERVMALRQNGERTQIAVLEDDVLVEHYVTRASATSYVGNVYLGRVQNVLPSMEAAFVDIGKGRNGVLYAGEVNWDAAGLEGKSRAIEDALKSGDTVLVQVTKDPIGHKGARLTSQVSLPGRFLVYVPGGGMTGISRRLPDTERHRLKAILKKIVPEDAGVIVRTAAEGASEEELTRDVERLRAQWDKISKQAQKSGSAPMLVHGEPDLAIRVVRDVFNEDFKKLIVQGDDAWNTVSEYVQSVAPDLADRLVRHTAEGDLFSQLRVDEQLRKALDRKVWLPSGGSLVIDRTEAMTVIDVNTGKFVGTGGNLEQTVTRNNLEAAEEIVRQLRLRDVGGIVVIDFIDMVLESNRDLVLRRLTECLARDRTKHQVAEVTSLGLVQMTRKRVGEGLLEAFSEPCPTCNGRGVIVHTDPVDRPAASPDGDDEERPRSRRRRGGAKKASTATAEEPSAEELAAAEEQRRARLAAMMAIHRAAHPDDEAAAEAAAEAELAAIEAAEAAESAEPPGAGGPEDAGDGATEQADAGVEAAEPQASSPSAATDPAEAAASSGPEVRPARRRRAASRPAGPPVVVG